MEFAVEPFFLSLRQDNLTQLMAAEELKLLGLRLRVSLAVVSHVSAYQSQAPSKGL